MRSSATRIQWWKICGVFIVGIIANLGKRCNGKWALVLKRNLGTRIIYGFARISFASPRQWTFFGR
jgi:hypothetical protein